MGRCCCRIKPPLSPSAAADGTAGERSRDFQPPHARSTASTTPRSTAATATTPPAGRIWVAAGATAAASFSRFASSDADANANADAPTATAAAADEGLLAPLGAGFRSLGTLRWRMASAAIGRARDDANALSRVCLFATSPRIQRCAAATTARIFARDDGDDGPAAGAGTTGNVSGRCRSRRPRLCHLTSGILTTAFLSRKRQFER